MRNLSNYDRFELPSGARYIRIPHNADPKKDDDWLEEMRLEMQDTPKDFRREILMDENVYDGEPVFPDYADSLHCPVKVTGGIPDLTYSSLWGGWDAGATLHPAFVLLGVTDLPFQVHCLLEVVRSGESMETFAPLVQYEVQNRIPRQWSDVNHFGDPTITTRAGTNLDTAQMVCKAKTGILIKPSTNVWTVRKGAVDWLLRDRISGADGKPTARFILDPRCTTLRKGFQGAYHLNLSPRGDTVGDGRILLEPVKDGYSHPMDALQYPSIEIKREIEKTSVAKVHRRHL